MYEIRNRINREKQNKNYKQICVCEMKCECLKELLPLKEKYDRDISPIRNEVRVIGVHGNEKKMGGF